LTGVKVEGFLNFEYREITRGVDTSKPELKRKSQFGGPIYTPPFLPSWDIKKWVYPLGI
jgi:hypothetical protein